MPKATANGIQLEYDTFGAPSSQPLLLIMGFAGQMIIWPEELCNQLAEQGLYVIRFDPRDVGLSSKLDEAGEPELGKILAAHQRGEEPEMPYTLEDMAADAIGLLDALSIDRAYLCGVAMGGMIAQIAAFRYPSRVSGLISWMCSTGDPNLPPGKPEVMAHLLKPSPAEREAYVEKTVSMLQAVHGPTFPPDAQLARSIAERAYDRGNHAPGIARHAAAIMTAGNRTQALKSITAPTLVIHGAEDPCFPVEHAKATADAISGAELVIIEGMGHGLSCPALWPRLVDAIAAHMKANRTP